MLLYLLATIGIVTIAGLLWRAFAPVRVGVGTRPRQRVVAPDDDPEFLRQLDERNRGEDD